MNIVQITPGAGGMYCGNCFRDNAMVAELRRQGHNTTMIPLYLPMTLEDTDQSTGSPIFFGGINVYLEQKFPWLKNMPDWLHKRLAAPGLLKWAAGKAAKTRAEELGDLTLSMLRGEDGNQVRELDELVAWLRQQPLPDVISLSNALLVGLARKIKAELDVPIVCMLQGEDYFLDSLPVSHREANWKTLAERAKDVDLFIAPSKYFAELMSRRLSIPPEKVQVIYNGIELKGYELAEGQKPPVLGYFARLCAEKGLPLLVDSYLKIRARNRVPNLKLHVGGGMGPSDEPVVAEMKAAIAQAGLEGEVSWSPNLTKEQKQRFFKGLSVFSVPALYGEAFGLYLLEAWAAGVPTIQPPVAAFSELTTLSNGGVTSATSSADDLAIAIEGLLLDENKRLELGKAGRKAVEERFNASLMTQDIVRAFDRVALAKV
jgi:glycosyltransferase involved in cell wall biosynthesis